MSIFILQCKQYRKTSGPKYQWLLSLFLYKRKSCARKSRACWFVIFKKNCMIANPQILGLFLQHHHYLPLMLYLNDAWLGSTNSCLDWRKGISCDIFTKEHEMKCLSAVHYFLLSAINLSVPHLTLSLRSYIYHKYFAFA